MAANSNTPEDINLEALQNTLSKASKAFAHNAAMKKAFQAIVKAVTDLGEVFADDYEAPAPKVRAKRGTGAIAQKKAQAQAPASEEGGGGVKNGRGSKKGGANGTGV